MRIGQEVTADDRDELSDKLGRSLRIGECLTADDVAQLARPKKKAAKKRAKKKASKR